MKAAMAALLLAASWAALAVEATKSRGGNPVMEVVELLQNLEGKVEKEGETEEELFTKYKCWATKSTDEKNEAMDEAAARIQSLNARIAELASMRGREGGEVKRVEGEIKGVNESMAEATKKFYEDSNASAVALNETAAAIAGLSTALDTLAVDTKGQDSALLALRGGRVSRNLRRKRTAAGVAKAMELSDKYLGVGDAAFMRSLLTSRRQPNDSDLQDVSKAGAAETDYVQGRSSKIMKTVNELKENFQQNYNKTSAEQGEDEKEYTAMVQEKTAQRSDLEKELARLIEDADYRAFEAQKAQDEIQALEDQTAIDQKFVEDVQAALTTKTAEWEERSAVRQDELTALSKAIALLNDADQKHIVKRAYATTLLQEASVSSKGVLVTASQAVREAGRAASDPRVLALAAGLARSGANFSDVFTKIDEMIKVLDDEEASDTEKKETCEKELAENQKDVQDTEAAIATLTEDAEGLDEDIEAIDKDVEEKEKEIVAADEELAAAESNRNAENEEYLKNKQDDNTAMTILLEATKVVKDFYDSQAKSFLQQGSREEPAADADAPATWDAGYSGSSVEGNGIIGMMDEAKKDLEEDMSKADTCEANAVKLYETAKASLEEQKANLQGQIDTLKVEKGSKSDDKTAKVDENTTKTEELATIEQKMKDVKPACDFYVGEYEKRQDNRKEEKQGLQKAKEILENYSSTTK